MSSVLSALPANVQLMYGLYESGGYEIPLARIKKFSEGMDQDATDSVFLESANTKSEHPIVIGGGNGMLSGHVRQLSHVNCARDDAGDERGREDGGDSGGLNWLATRPLGNSIPERCCPGRNGPIGQPTFEILGQGSGRNVTARGIFLQALEGDVN